MRTSKEKMAALLQCAAQTNSMVGQAEHKYLLRRIDQAILRGHINRLYANQTLPPKKVQRWPL